MLRASPGHRDLPGPSPLHLEPDEQGEDLLGLGGTVHDPGAPHECGEKVGRDRDQRDDTGGAGAGEQHAGQRLPTTAASPADAPKSRCR